MNKVVYNKCFGGFELSIEAQKMYLEKKGIKYTEDRFYLLIDGNAFIDESIPRHDEALISVVEELGEKANNTFSLLAIKEISGNVYRIDSYDGQESIIEPNDEKYITIQK